MTAGPGQDRAAWNGSLGEGERAELVKLRQENLHLRKRLDAKAVWWPGQPVPDGCEPFIGTFEADYQVAVREMTRTEIQHQEARRQAAAHGYRTGTTDQYPGTLAESLARPRPAQQDLIGGLWPAAGNLSIEAIYKTGKTTLAGAAIGSVVDGTPFLGFAPAYPPAGRVGIWNCEMDEHHFDDYMAPHIAGRDRVAVAHLRGHPMPLLSSPAARDELVRWLRYWHVEVWVADSWTRLCAWSGIDPLDNSGVAKLTAAVDEIKAEAGVKAAAFTGHMPQAAKTDRTFERSFGAQAYSAWVDCMWRYTMKGEKRYLAAGGRNVHLDECQVLMGGDGRLTAVSGGRGTGRDHSGEDPRDVAAAVADRIRRHPGLSGNAIEKDLADYGRASVRTALRLMEEDGRITIRPGKRGTREHYLADADGGEQWLRDAAGVIGK